MKKYLKKMLVVILIGVCTMTFATTAYASGGSSLWDTIRDTVSDVSDAVKENAPGVIDAAKEKGSELAGKAKDGLSTAGEAIGNFRDDQEGQFWDWFGNQTQPSKNQTSNTEQSTSLPDGTGEKDSTIDPTPDPGESIPPVYYYDPEPDRTPADAATGTIIIDNSNSTTIIDNSTHNYYYADSAESPAEDSLLPANVTAATTTTYTKRIFGLEWEADENGNLTIGSMCSMVVCGLVGIGVVVSILFAFSDQNLLKRHRD